MRCPTRLCTLATLALGLLAFPAGLPAQQKPEIGWDVRSLGGAAGGAMYNSATKLTLVTNAFVRYGDAVLTADSVALNYETGEAFADGHVRVQQGDQPWASDHLRYNFHTHQMEAGQFRTGLEPMFAAGSGLHGELTNHLYVATNAVVTADDISDPDYVVRARRIKIIPGEKLVAYDAVLYIKGVPVFYTPYYSRNIGEHANNFNFTPGYRSLYGAFVLGNYTWYMNDQLDGILHVDYRSKRGPGVGPDFNYHFGQWGEGSFRYYYTHDKDSTIGGLGVPIPEDRQRVVATYLGNPATNLSVRGVVNYESDLAVRRDFFVGEYQIEPQPKTFLEANKFWQNFSLDAYVQPRVDNFLQTVERLPDIKLTGYRQQIGATPLYYHSESSAGYYEMLFAANQGTNGPPPGTNYAAARADTYQEVLLPKTFFGWLNITPRVGGRLTYYSAASGPGATTDEEYRGVFNTGAEISFKASRLWPAAQNSLFEVDGLRHIIEPSATYVFIPDPSVPPSQLPQFDSVLPSLRLLPNQFPEFNAIDSIDSLNSIRWGLHNKLQTKRAGQVVDLVDWNLYTDWYLEPNEGQTTFSDLYSDLILRPRSWLALESLIRYEIDGGLMRMSYTTVTFQPNTTWRWSVGQYYLRDDFSSSPTALGAGNNVLTSTLYFRLNENWGFRTSHYFEAQTGQLQEQSYTLYRDMRSWTAALTFLDRNNPGGPQDYTVAFTFSLKAFPHFGMGGDTMGPSSLLGR